MWGLVRTVSFSIFVGRGIGPDTLAPVESAVLMMSRHALSITRASYALSFIRILPLGIITPTHCHPDPAVRGKDLFLILDALRLPE